jgi:hypothetical protein
MARARGVYAITLSQGLIASFLPSSSSSRFQLAYHGCHLVLIVHAKEENMMVSSRADLARIINQDPWYIYNRIARLLCQDGRHLCGSSHGFICIGKFILADQDSPLWNKYWKLGSRNKTYISCVCALLLLLQICFVRRSNTRAFMC